MDEHEAKAREVCRMHDACEAGCQCGLCDAARNALLASIAAALRAERRSGAEEMRAVAVAEVKTLGGSWCPNGCDFDYAAELVALLPLGAEPVTEAASAEPVSEDAPHRVGDTWVSLSSCVKPPPTARTIYARNDGEIGLSVDDGTVTPAMPARYWEKFWRRTSAATALPLDAEEPTR